MLQNNKDSTGANNNKINDNSKSISNMKTSESVLDGNAKQDNT